MKNKFIMKRGPLTGTLSLLPCLNHLNNVSLTSLLSGLRIRFKFRSAVTILAIFSDRLVCRIPDTHQIYFFPFIICHYYFNFSFHAQNLPL